jgi:carbamoyltransferase
VLAERADEVFELAGRASPYMLLAVPVREAWRERIGAVVHVDGTSRVQTVARDEQPAYWSVIHEFDKLTGAPLVLNTSFNVQGEPIVAAPDDAVRCFLGTGIDALALGDYLAVKP